MVDSKIRQLLYDGVCESIKEATSQVNKAVFEMAEKEGCSIWDICFHFIPEYSYVTPQFKELEKHTPVIQTEGYVRLVPLELEFEKGPGYWKNKYYRLKEKMREIIDDKNDGEK